MVAVNQIATFREIYRFSIFVILLLSTSSLSTRRRNDCFCEWKFLFNLIYIICIKFLNVHISRVPIGFVNFFKDFHYFPKKFRNFINSQRLIRYAKIFKSFRNFFSDFNEFLNILVVFKGIWYFENIKLRFLQLCF